MATKALAGFGTKLLRGEETGTDPATAAVTLGSGNAQVKVTARAAGTEGNSITVALVASGNNTPLSISVTAKAITVNLATNGSGSGTSTAAQVITALNSNSEASRLVTASVGTGDGTGTAAAATATALTGGSVGTRAFVEIKEVRNIELSGEESDEIDVSNMSSPDRRREFIGGLIDAGSCDFEINYVPQEVTHDLIRADLGTQTVRPWRLQLTDSPATMYNFLAYVKSFSTSMANDDAITANVSLRISGSFTLMR